MGNNDGWGRAKNSGAARVEVTARLKQGKALHVQGVSLDVAGDVDAEVSTSEAAEALELSEENVKVRLHRGRSMLRRQIFERVGATTKDVFPFMGERCDRVVRNVLRIVSSIRS